MNYKPMANRIIVERDKRTEKIGSIVIGHAQQERPQEGTVKAVGPGNINERTGKRNPMTVNVGERVCWPKFSGNNIKGTDDLWIMPETDVLAVIYD